MGAPFLGARPLAGTGLDPTLDDKVLRGLVRLGLARLLAERDREAAGAPGEARAPLVQRLRESPIAVDADAANAQHYDVPPDFFRLVLGRRMKYSAGYWPPEVATLDESEEAALDLACARARLEDGHRVLDLGCGWGALTLRVAETRPRCQVTGITNSSRQRAFIEEEAARRGLANVRVVSADISGFAPEGRFDRIVSIEMLEHVRNHERLFARIASWLEDGGRFFVHVFTHVRHAYLMEDNWIARRFFTGGLMPSDDLLPQLDAHLTLEDHWRLSGTHYQRTAEAWLANLDRRREEARAVLARHHGPEESADRLALWRLFFIVCAESFGFRGGEEWGVSHYLFRAK